MKKCKFLLWALATVMPSRVNESRVSAVQGEFNLAIGMFSMKNRVNICHSLEIQYCWLRLSVEQESAFAYSAETASDSPELKSRSEKHSFWLSSWGSPPLYNLVLFFFYKDLGCPSLKFY